MNEKNILGFDPSELKIDPEEQKYRNMLAVYEITKNEFESDLAFLGLTKEEWQRLENIAFDWYEKNEPKYIINELIEKYKDKDCPIGDLARDVLNDDAIAPYMSEGLSADDFFTYIANNCCDDCFYNALEPLRKKYNKIVGNSPWKLVKIRGERTYDYVWFNDYLKDNTILKYYDFLSKFEIL